MWIVVIVIAVLVLGGGDLLASITNADGSLYTDPQGGDLATSSIQSLAEAIARFEGFYVADSIPERNNNPGDLRPPNGNPNFWAGQIGTDINGFAIFPDAETGWQALYKNLTVHVSKNPNQTLAGYIAQYAPSADKNNPVAYAAAVASALGASITDTLGSLFLG